MIILSLNLSSWRTCDNGLFLFAFEIKTPQVLGIREDPCGCDRPPRALGAFLFLRKGQKNAPGGFDNLRGLEEEHYGGNFQKPP
jgi:hypothetical protein